MSAFLVAPFFLSAQQKWGYSIASVRLPADSAKMVEIVFVSGVKKLSSLNCSTTTDVAADDDYERCLCDWLYERIAQTNIGALSFIDKNLMYADIELYNNPPLAYRSRLKTTTDHYPTIFLTRKEAEKRRKRLLALANSNSNIIVQVD